MTASSLDDCVRRPMGVLPLRSASMTKRLTPGARNSAWMILKKWPPGVRNDGFLTRRLCSEADGEAVIEITVPCADDFWQSADLLQVPANYGFYRIFGESCRSGAPHKKRRVSLTQRLNPQNLFVLRSSLLKGKKPGPCSVRASSR